MCVMDLFNKDGDGLPKTFVLDMGCLFRRFAKLRVRDDKPWTQKLWKELAQFTIVNYFHIKNHSPNHVYCRKYCNPNTKENKERLGDASTIVCERTFSCLALYRPMTVKLENDRDRRGNLDAQ